MPTGREKTGRGWGHAWRASPAWRQAPGGRASCAACGSAPSRPCRNAAPHAVPQCGGQLGKRAGEKRRQRAAGQGQGQRGRQGRGGGQQGRPGRGDGQRGSGGGQRGRLDGLALVHWAK